MKFNAAGLLLCTFLMSCGGTAPFGEPEEEVVEETPDEEVIGSERTLPPGTASPQPNTTIFRKEAQDDDGNGFASNVVYNAEDDTFSVDNLPFDGGPDTPYVRGVAVSSFGEYAVYESVEQFPDALNDNLITQTRHRAIYGVSRSGATEFAIVRTGDYVDYGFGGFVYERNGTVTLPTEGQARYDGTGAGLRDHRGRGGLEYTSSDVRIQIDFDDFNAETGRFEGAVEGFMYNRRIFDLAGTEITNNVLDRINADANASLTSIPTAVFVVATNSLDANGEIVGTLTSQFSNDAGEAVQYETGNYYGIISGDDGEELVGIIVTETAIDPTADAIRETAGFTIYRGSAAAPSSP